MIPQSSNIFCIIVHFGSQEPTNALIQQLGRGDRTPKGIIVVDNGGDPFQTQATPVPVVVTRAGRNGGYAAGINIGMRTLSRWSVHPTDIIVVSNNDVGVSASTLSVVADWCAKQKQPTLAAHLLGHVNLLTGRAHISPVNSANTPFAIPYAHGSCLVASNNTWRMLGQLPEQYFLYWEDVVLSMQAHMADITLQQLPPCGISHDDTQEQVSREKEYFLVRNGASVLEAWTPSGWPLYWRAANQMRLIYHRIRGREAIVQALMDRKII